MVSTAVRIVSWSVALVVGFGALVATLFVAVAASAFFVSPVGPKWVQGGILLVFFTPMAILFWRAAWLAVRSARGKPPEPVFTPALSWTIALVIGVPALVSCVAMPFIDPSTIGQALTGLPIAIALVLLPKIVPSGRD